MQQSTPIVFVVDDDITIRESLELLIRFEGWRPETYASANEFLARPAADVASCLILDVSLPDLSGLDVQKRIAGRRAEMPIIFITGHGDIPMSVEAMKAELPRIPWNRPGEPWEVARIALYLASEDADYVTGQSFTIDGGLEMNWGQGA